MLDFLFSLEDGGIPPIRATAGSAAFDLCVPETELKVVIFPGHVTTLNLRIKVAIPEGHAGIMLPRSGLGSKQGLCLANTVGLIDSDYRDSLIAKLTLSDAATERPKNAPLILRALDPILQLFIVPLPALRAMEVSELPDAGTERKGGFGSTTEMTLEKNNAASRKGFELSLSEIHGEARGKSVGSGPSPASSGHKK